MTSRERFLKTLSFQKPDYILPMIEWAAWWDKTTDRWKDEGLPKDISWNDSIEFIDLDKLICISAGTQSLECTTSACHGAPIITNEKSYEEIRSWPNTESIIENLKKTVLSLKELFLWMTTKSTFSFLRNTHKSKSLRYKLLQS